MAMAGRTKKIEKLFYAGEQFLDNAASDPEASALLAEQPELLGRLVRS
jgi:hypothetical protein